MNYGVFHTGLAMKVEFVDLLFDTRNACGYRNKMKFATAVLLHVVGLHAGLRRISDRAVKYFLANSLISIAGCKFYLLDADSLDVISPRFEYFVEPWLRVKQADVFIDIGAHIGKYAIRFAKKASKVIAIEPSRETFRVLVRNLSVNRLENVTAVEVAAWNGRTELPLYSGRYAGQNSTKEVSSKWERIRGEPIDSIVSRNQLSRVDWIKIDVEGAEVEVLEGATRTIDGMKPTIIVEVWMNNERKLKAFADRMQYGVIRISPLRYPNRSSYWVLTALGNVKRED
jgi:FkbM family methyltransferase